MAIGDYLAKDINKALELWQWHRAAELGDCRAHFEIGKALFVDGDMEKAIHHMKLAAIGGHEGARHLLGLNEVENGNTWSQQ